MTQSEMYWKRAAEERAAAAKTDLPNRQAMLERSAAVWEEMARAVEDTAERTAVNAAAKAAR
jgi:hypothetical protein